MRLNDATRSLSNIIHSVSQSMDVMQDVVGKIGQSADEMSRRTSSQAVSLEETTAAMQMINESVREASHKTLIKRQFFEKPRREMKKSTSHVQTAANVMNDISSSSERISHIIGLIDDIAFQTNLLALNAGGEAALAGDAGRGFAVVAEEFHTLADYSPEAANEIRALIQSSSEQVNEGVFLVERARSSLTGILGSFDTMFGVLNSIAEGSSEPATGLNEINQSIGELDRITQSNTAMVEQTSDSMGKIVGVVQNISGQLSQLRYTGQAQSPGWSVQAGLDAQSVAWTPGRARAPDAKGRVVVCCLTRWSVV